MNRSATKLREIVRLATEGGGLTVRIADGWYPDSGFAVSQAGHEENHAELTPSLLEMYLADHSEAFDCRDACLGIWRDEAHGLWCLDVSYVLDDIHMAMVAARQADQRAIYNLGTRETVRIAP